MIYLMRHGLDDENYIGGWSDVDLTLEGINQVENTITKMLANDIKINKIISSDIKRAITTAELVKEKYHINQIEINSIFREQNKGELNGLEKSIAEEKYPEYLADIKTNTIYPNGESLENLYNKIKNNLEYIASLEDDTLIITHRGVINMLYYILYSIPLDMDKKKFDVTHASLHEFNLKKLTIRKVI